MASRKIASENPQCPTGHYDSVSCVISVSCSSVRKPPMPDRALRPKANCPSVVHKIGQKTPNARQGITTMTRRSTATRSTTSENPQCPTGHYDFSYFFRNVSTFHLSENPQCPTGHYDILTAIGYELPDESENPQCPTGPKQLTMAQ